MVVRQLPPEGGVLGEDGRHLRLRDPTPDGLKQAPHRVFLNGVIEPAMRWFAGL